MEEKKKESHASQTNTKKKPQKKPLKKITDTHGEYRPGYYLLSVQSKQLYCNAEWIASANKFITNKQIPLKTVGAYPLKEQLFME